MRTIEIDTTTKLVTEECCSCGVLFAMPKALEESLRTTGKSFYCPVGHPQHYTNSTEKRLKEAEDKLWREQNHSADLSRQLNGTLLQFNENKKELRRVKRRVQAGVCTECHRHFANLQSHMESKHK